MINSKIGQMSKTHHVKIGQMSKGNNNVGSMAKGHTSSGVINSNNAPSQQQINETSKEYNKYK